MTLLQIVILSIVQGAAELLPISSSAHVILAEKLMGLESTSPEMTLLLVMLHTGTMFAVIVFFWQRWKSTYFQSTQERKVNFRFIVVATVTTGVVGLALQQIIKHIVARDNPAFEIEDLFGNLKLMAVSLAAAGVLIIISSRMSEKRSGQLTTFGAAIIGAVQGLCLPFRGFSRSGATISTGLALGASRRRAEEFSFALAVVLTPVVIAREVLRLMTHQRTIASATQSDLYHMLALGLLGMVLSFVAGLLALRWLSHWLESGRWYLFGAYCLVVAVFALWLS